MLMYKPIHFQKKNGFPIQVILNFFQFFIILTSMELYIIQETLKRETCLISPCFILNYHLHVS